MIIIAFFKTINFLSNSIKTVFQACRSRYNRHRRSSSSSSSSSSAGSFVFDHLDDQFERSIEYFMMTVLESDQQQENHQMYFIPPGCINIEQLDSISPKHLFVSKIVGNEENDNNESTEKKENNNNSDNNDNEKEEKDKQLKQEKNKKSLETVVNSSSSSSSSSNTENSQLDDEKQKQKQQQISPDDIDLEKGQLELENLQTKYESYGTDSVCAICQESLKINVEEEQEAQEEEQQEQENDDSDAKTIQKSIENPINDNNIPKQEGERQAPNTGVVRTLPCNHTFHSKCITIWVTRRRGCCPLCNRDLQKYFPTES